MYIILKRFAMSLQFWLLYCSTVFVVSIIPGPSMLLALTHGMQFGVRKAVISTLGVTISTLIQAIISMAGLGAILIASEVLFLTVKIAGGATYLVYLGIMLILSKGGVYQTNFEKAIIKPNNKQLLQQGIMVAILNPKAIIFFTALFPQFIHVETASMTSYSILLISLVIIQIFCSLTYAFAGKRIIMFFKNSGRFF